MLLRINPLAQILDVIGRANERQGDPVDRLHQHEVQVPEILLRQGWQGYLCVRKIHPLIGGKDAAKYDPEADLLLLVRFHNFKNQLPVVNQDPLSYIDVFGKLLITHIYPLPGPFARRVDKSDLFPLLQFQTVVFHLAYPEFRPLQISQYAYVQSVFLIDIGNVVDHLLMVFMRAVRKIEPENVNTRLYQIQQVVIGAGCRTNRRNDLGVLMIYDLKVFSRSIHRLDHMAIIGK